MNPAPLRFTTQRRVEFRDTDAAGIAHFSAFFVYMEQAEHALRRELGESVVSRDDQGEIGWPRARAACEYHRPAKFEDILDIEVTIERLGRKSVTFAFRFTCAGVHIASGTLTTVCCRIRPGTPPQSIDIPESLAQKLRGRATPHAT